MRELGSRMYDRCYAPDGILRQLAAMIRWAPTPEALGSLDAFLHNPWEGGRSYPGEAALDIARILKNSEVHIYPGLGHEIPQPLWDEFATIIMRTAARA